MRATSRFEPPRLYVALGDSFSAGAGSGAPGFAERLAALLGAVGYWNLAVTGASTPDVAERQLPRGIALAPDVVTVVCGGNDALLSVRPDLAAHAAGVEHVLGTLRITMPHARIATATTPDPARFLGLRPRSAARVARAIEAINEATRRSARRHGVPLLDFAAHPEARIRGNYDTDGYHPSAAAADRAARAFARILGAGLIQQEAS